VNGDARVCRKPLDDEDLRACTVGEPTPLCGPIHLVDYDPEWPHRFEREAAGIRSALSGRALRIEHAGSTSVPGLPAKPVIDIVLIVNDSARETEYAPALEGAGYRQGCQPPCLLRDLPRDRPHDGLPQPAEEQRKRSGLVCPIKEGTGPEGLEVHAELRRREDRRYRRDHAEGAASGCVQEKSSSRVSMQTWRSDALSVPIRARPALKTARDESPRRTRLSRSCRGRIR